MLDRQTAGRLDEGDPFDRAGRLGEQRALRDQRLGEQLGQLVALGDRQAAIDEGEPLLDPVLAEPDPGQAADERGQVALVGDALGFLDRRFEQRLGRVHATEDDQRRAQGGDRPEPSRHVAHLAAELDRLPEEGLGAIALDRVVAARPARSRIGARSAGRSSRSAPVRGSRSRPRASRGSSRDRPHRRVRAGPGWRSPRPRGRPATPARPPCSATASAPASSSSPSDSKKRAAARWRARRSRWASVL